MHKLFIYDVAGTEFADSVAFGDAWKQAKAKAKAEHVAIYRTVIKGDNEDVRREVYYKGGVFNSIKYATADNVEIF